MDEIKEQPNKSINSFKLNIRKKLILLKALK
jgi:hypothetical protein